MTMKNSNGNALFVENQFHLSESRIMQLLKDGIVFVKSVSMTNILKKTEKFKVILFRKEFVMHAEKNFKGIVKEFFVMTVL